MNNDWQVVRIGDIAETYDGPHATPKKTTYGPVFLGIGNLVNGRIDLSNPEYLSEEDFKKWTRRITPQENDLVFSYETRLGEAALIPPGLRCCLGRRMGLLRFNTRVVDPKFMLFAWLGVEFQETIRQYTVHGSTVDRILLTELPDFPINLPPLSEQRAIAHILGSLDDKIEANRRMNATLEAAARALFKSWFVDFDPVHAKSRGEQPAGMDAAMAALFPDHFEDSELGPIPAGWGVTSLGELFPHDRECVLTGPFGSKLHAHDYRDEGVPLILVKHVNNGHIIEDDLPLVGAHKTPELDRYRLSIGDIVFTRVGAVGRTAYIHPRYENWLISGQMLRVRIPDYAILNSRYLSQVYLEPSFMDMVESFSLGTTRPSLNTKILQQFRFLLPRIEIQNLFAELVNSFDQRVQNNLEQSHTLAESRDALLPRLVSGEIRVDT